MADVATERLTRADRAWFADQVETLLPGLYSTAVRLCRDRTDAEDLVADAVAKAWESLPTLRDRHVFRGWVFRILTNAFVSQYRSRRAQTDVTSLDAGDEEFSLFERLHQPMLLWWGNPEQEFLNGLLREDLATAIDELPGPFRAAVLLVDVQGLSYQDVATAMDVPVGTVRSRLARGRGLLQKVLWENAHDAGLRTSPSRTSGKKEPDEPD